MPASAQPLGAEDRVIRLAVSLDCKHRQRQKDKNFCDDRNGPRPLRIKSRANLHHSFGRLT
jgi:hypothetical protein